MVELIKWWNNSTVRDILRYHFRTQQSQSQAKSLLSRKHHNIGLLCNNIFYPACDHYPRFCLDLTVNLGCSNKLIRNGLRCLFGITLWKIKSALPPGTNQFSWHPNLFGLAIILYTEAYWVKRSFNPYYLRSLFGLGWTGRNRLHVLLSALASYSSYYGLYSIWVTKNMNNKPHFTSWHGQVGLASMTGWSGDSGQPSGPKPVGQTVIDLEINLLKQSFTCI